MHRVMGEGLGRASDLGGQSQPPSCSLGSTEKTNKDLLTQVSGYLDVFCHSWRAKIWDMGSLMSYSHF